MERSSRRTSLGVHECRMLPRSLRRGSAQGDTDDDEADDDQGDGGVAGLLLAGLIVAGARDAGADEEAGAAGADGDVALARVTGGLGRERGRDQRREGARHCCDGTRAAPTVSRPTVARAIAALLSRPSASARSPSAMPAPITIIEAPVAITTCRFVGWHPARSAAAATTTTAVVEIRMRPQ